ncbi:MAG: bifunctional phosphoglucose/phosphomannose isomerase [Actinobacteria bacterium]|nr:bifunctional phosphoglucose/phosphomannose isomerase [Actinomycetota bacterium]
MSVDLDDVQGITKLDSEDVLGATERFAEQCRQAWALGRAARDLPDADGVENVVVLGMGGSGISGDVVQALVEPRLGVPWRTIKGYGPLPEWIGRNTLTFVVSYSGDTEETLAAFEEIHSRGARPVAVSSGGHLAELATGYGVAHVRVPEGLQPRASLGFLALPLLAILVEIGLVPDCSDDVDEAVASLADISKNCSRDIPVDENMAKQLATSLAGRVPVVYGGSGLGEVAAYRFKCDLNEYAKTPAFANSLPEMNHNELEALASANREDFVAVLLRDAEDHERVALRFDVAKKLLERTGAEVIEVRSQGISPLARLLTLVLITQLAAIYGGLLNDVDPGPVPVIEDFKRQLADQ